MSSPAKQRLDLLLVERGLAPTRQRARALIMAGKVSLQGRVADKPGTLVAAGQTPLLQASDLPYVGRGGLKLAAALQAFAVPVAGRVCLDVGASTGGFSDCLLQHGATRVYAVDVGYGQLAWGLRQDPRVILLERTNIRYLERERIPEPVQLAVIDVSFISLRLVVPAVLPFLEADGCIVALIKPQFEVGRGKVGKGGVVRNASQHETLLMDLIRFFGDAGLVCTPPLPSPITGAKGNREFLIALHKKPL